MSQKVQGQIQHIFSTQKWHDTFSPKFSPVSKVTCLNLKKKKKELSRIETNLQSVVCSFEQSHAY